MREGLYRASFFKTDPELGIPRDEFGRGVVNLREGKIVGGDSNYFYAGTYALDGTKLEATVTVTPHTAIDRRTLFSRGAILDLKGSADAAGIRCGGMISTSPGDSIQIRLTWLVE